MSCTNIECLGETVRLRWLTVAVNGRLSDKIQYLMHLHTSKQIHDTCVVLFGTQLFIGHLLYLTQGTKIVPAVQIEIVQYGILLSSDQQLDDV